jgi:hypothetical protein
MKSYSGYYINLDRRTDRRAGVENEIARFGLNGLYTRIPGIDGNAAQIPGPLTDGQKGCFASHTLALETGAVTGQHLHIVEDDVLFGPATAQGLDLVIEKGWLANYDIIFTEIFVPIARESFTTYKALYDNAVARDANGNISSVSFGVADLKHKVFGGAVSYLVNSASVSKLRALYRAELENGPELPFDLFLRQLCNTGILRTGLIFPFITAMQINASLASDINSDTSISFLAEMLARQAFFIGCDWNECLMQLQKHLPLPPPQDDPHKRILAHLLAFNAADGF